MPTNPCADCDGVGMVALPGTDDAMPCTACQGWGTMPEPVPVRCPWCATGHLTISDGETVDWWHTGFHVLPADLPLEDRRLASGLGLEKRVRPCRMAGCNACEFVVELDAEGRPILLTENQLAKS
jgi:hypothetical protein